MPGKLKIPPQFFPLKKDGSCYVIVRYDDGFFDVAYYRPYFVGEDGVTDAQSAEKMHKRFAVRKAKLRDALCVVFAEDLKTDWDIDAVEVMIRSDRRPSLPAFPGKIHKDYSEEETEDDVQWVPVQLRDPAQKSLLDETTPDPT